MSMLRASLDAENYDREYSNRDLVQRVTTYFQPHLGKFSLIVLMVCFLSLRWDWFWACCWWVCLGGLLIGPGAF